MFNLTDNAIAELVRVVADAHPQAYIEQIRTLRTILGCGLKEGKDLVDAERTRRKGLNPVIDVLNNIRARQNALRGY